MWLSEGFKSDNKTCSIHIITHFKNWSNYFLPLLKSEFLEPPEIFLYVRKMEVHTPLNIKNLSQSVKIERGWSNKIGGDLLSRGCAVPSARLGLTSLFGMGRGDPQRYNHQNIVWTTLRFYDLEAISFSFTFFLATTSHCTNFEQARPLSQSGCKFRAISKARLWHRCLYTCLLSTSSSLTTLIRKSNLVAGFALRCFQRLSDPDMDTRRCAWRHNR